MSAEAWKLVPTEPTPDMLTDAGSMDGFVPEFAPESLTPDECHIRWWKAMLAASPSPSVGQGFCSELTVTSDGAAASPGGADDDVTAWLIEEVWVGPSCGQIHYLHRDFDPVRWLAEARSIDALPYEQRVARHDHGGCSISWGRRSPKIPFITKNIDEAMRFDDEASANAWLAAQPSFLNHSDQYQPREHMWPAPISPPDQAAAQAKPPSKEPS